MFTDGQYIFAGFFVVLFIAIMIFSYRKDLKLHKKYYRGSLFILAGFLLFVAILFLIKTYLH
ncbi:hypothetical protein [Mesonia maritima]|uniref:DUF3953 domain-containing protein n=1 Tax=Mesonia maritima TaxID=1793873 RepID=A0ABU1K5F2_9FLAO|nr:hypothetical protein [Mesonia maritima]MDR6300531.1 hypothetical protein [Mesonia maritima]